MTDVTDTHHHMCFQGQDGTLQDSWKLQLSSHSPQYLAYNCQHWKVGVPHTPQRAFSLPQTALRAFSSPPQQQQPHCLFCNTVRLPLNPQFLLFKRHHLGFCCVNFVKPPSPQKVDCDSTPMLSTWRKCRTRAASVGRGSTPKRWTTTTWICTTISRLIHVPTVTPLTPTRPASGNTSVMAFVKKAKCNIVTRSHYWNCVHSSSRFTLLETCWWNHDLVKFIVDVR